MKISIIHPSRSRPQQAHATYKKWMSSAKNSSDIQYIVSIDSLDHEWVEYINNFFYNNAWHTVPELGRQVLYDKNLFVVKEYNDSAIDAINTAVKECSGDLLIVVSDDFDCPFHWDVALLEMLNGKEDFLVKTRDGIQKTLITLPIMDRKYYNRFGYIYNPEYKHMFCDQEMTAVGHLLGRVIELPITFPHNHYTTNKTRKDHINEKNDATWNQGKEVFQRNMQNNFGIENPVISYSQIVWH